jgi:hypothetical protein
MDYGRQRKWHTHDCRYTAAATTSLACTATYLTHWRRQHDDISTVAHTLEVFSLHGILILLRAAAQCRPGRRAHQVDDVKGGCGAIHPLQMVPRYQLKRITYDHMLLSSHKLPFQLVREHCVRQDALR